MLVGIVVVHRGCVSGVFKGFVVCCHDCLFVRVRQCAPDAHNSVSHAVCLHGEL